MADPFQSWLERHLKDATQEYKRTQAIEEAAGSDQELYERVHQMWGYLSGLEKCLKEFKALHRAQPRKAARKPARKRRVKR